MVQWITHFENPQWKVESNATNAETDKFYTWEKSFVRVTWKVAGEIFCYINGEKYNFYHQNEQVVLEITDLVRANAGGLIVIHDYDGEYLTEVESIPVQGERPTFSNQTFLPNEIPYSKSNVIDFWLELCQKQDYFNSIGEWMEITSGNWVTEPSAMPLSYNAKLNQNNENPIYKFSELPTLRVSDTTNFEINETSGAYGFAYRTVDLKKGETYKFSANGNSAGAAVGAKLFIELSKHDIPFYRSFIIDNDANTTESVTFEAPETGTYGIASFYYPHGAPAGTVTVNCYKVELISGRQTKLIDLPCTNEHILFEWTGRFGVKKSWWFKKESVISEATKTINLQTLDNGFSTLKDKNTNLIISHRNADNLTQHYLSDIVLSDEVYCYPDETAESKLQVRVETNSFEVGLNNRDIVLTINKNAYDTI